MSESIRALTCKCAKAGLRTTGFSVVDWIGAGAGTGTGTRPSVGCNAKVAYSSVSLHPMALDRPKSLTVPIASKWLGVAKMSKSAPISSCSKLSQARSGPCSLGPGAGRRIRLPAAYFVGRGADWGHFFWGVWVALRFASSFASHKPHSRQLRAFDAAPGVMNDRRAMYSRALFRRQARPLIFEPRIGNPWHWGGRNLAVWSPPPSFN